MPVLIARSFPHREWLAEFPCFRLPNRDSHQERTLHEARPWCRQVVWSILVIARLLERTGAGAAGRSDSGARAVCRSRKSGEVNSGDCVPLFFPLLPAAPAPFFFQ